MRILIAPQEFKGTLTAVEASEAMARGLQAGFAEAELDLLPMADGGPGTVDALLTALGGQRQLTPSHDPLMRPVESAWGLLPGSRGVIECAAASGLWRMQAAELNPTSVRMASSRGTGELVRAALDAGLRDLVIGLGGSATNDGGADLAKALGFRFLDATGSELPPGGAALARLAHIDASAAHPALRQLKVLGATDVTNPLCGPTGASAIYGPQKGADAAAIQDLDAALANLARVIRTDLGIDVAETPGAGAAGGLGAALLAFLGAKLSSGAEVVGSAAGIAARVALADVVITGEGRLDLQTAYGKTPQYVARHAQDASKPCICIAGQLGPGHESSDRYFAAVEALSDGTTSALPTRDEAAQQVAAAVVRALLRVV